MRHLFLYCLIILSMNQFVAQDVIYLKTNEQIKAKISEIKEKFVTYKKFDNLSGPEYEIPKTKITIIVYENGTSEQFNNSKPIDNTLKNVISLNYGDLTVGRVALNYERYIYKQKLSLKIPLAISYTNNYYDERPKVLTGLDINYYPLGIKKISYFTGVGTQVGILNVFNYLHEFSYTADYYYPNPINSKRYFGGAYINNGITIIPVDNFSISGQLGIGFRDIESYTPAQPSVIGQLNASFRF